MNQNFKTINRRTFLQTTAVTAVGTGTFGLLPLSGFCNSYIDDENIHILGPVKGYSPHIGIFVSMLNWMRNTIIQSTKNLTQPELDFLIDPKGNTMGALLLHLAGIEVVYQDRTFYNLKTLSEPNKQKWSAAIDLGDAGRNTIKGNNIDYYHTALKEVRELTVSELKKRDDKWFALVDPNGFGKKPTNNFCKWFHVCEHEANHRGQIAMIKKRLPGKDAGND